MTLNDEFDLYLNPSQFKCYTTSITANGTLSLYFETTTNRGSYDIYKNCTKIDSDFLYSNSDERIAQYTVQPGENYAINIGNPDTTGGIYGLEFYFKASVSPPSKAITPLPTNTATDIGLDEDLRWGDGGGAESYDVYFGTNPTPGYIKNQEEKFFDPGTLQCSTTYHWRINAKNSAGTTPGTLWSFTTQLCPNTPPKLESPTIFPGDVVTIGTAVTFGILYIDDDHDIPTINRIVFVEGGYSPQSLTHTSLHPYNGFYEKTMSLDVGTHTYYFEFSDGKEGGLVRNPASGVHTLTVEASNHTPTIETYVTPAVGSTESSFNYTAHYRDSDGHPPVVIKATINGVDHNMTLQPGSGTASDGDYETSVDGSVLGIGTHSYTIFADDGHPGGQVTTLPINSPTVEAPRYDIDINMFRSTPKFADPGDTVTITGELRNLGNTAVDNINGIIFIQSDISYGKNFNPASSIMRAVFQSGSIPAGGKEDFEIDIKVPEILENGWDYEVVINVEELVNETDVSNNKQFYPIIATENSRGPELGAVCRGPKGGDPVNTALGNFYHEVVDLQYPGIGIPFRFERVYNSQGGIDGPMGAYWNHSYNIYLHIDTEEKISTGNVTVVYGDGKRHKYKKISEGVYEPPLGIFRTLVKDTSTGIFTITRKNKEKYIFDSNGKLTAIADRFGNNLSFTYTGDNLTKITDTSGREILLTYAAIAGQDRITSIQGPYTGTNVQTDASYQQKISYQYDSYGNLISAGNPDFQPTSSYEYSTNHDGKHLLTKVRNSNIEPAVVMNTYGEPDGTPSDHGFYVVKQVYADSGETTFEYDLNQKKTTITGTDGLQRLQFYDEYYRLVQETDPEGFSSLYHYDSNGNRDWVENKRGNRTTFSYDQWNNLILETGPDSVSTYLEYTANNDIKKKIEAYNQLNHEWLYSWSMPGEVQLESVTDPEGKTTQFTYYPNGLKKTATDPEGNTTQFFYDGFGNLNRIVDAEGHETTSVYDSRGLVTRKVDSLGFWTNYAYDHKDNLLQEENQQGIINYWYDGNNNRTKKIDQQMRTTEYIYDSKDRLIVTRDPLLRSTSTQYDTSDRKIKTTDVWNNETFYSYSPAGYLKTVTDAEGEVTTYNYDPDGNRLETIDPAGKIWRFGYDSRNRLTSETDPLMNTTGYQYDLLGKLLVKTDAMGNSTQFTYDKRGLLKTVTDPEGGQSIFTYDDNGSRIAERDVRGNSVSYTYDGLKRPITTTDRNGKITAVTYHGSTTLNATKTNGDGETANYILYPDRPLIKTIHYPGVMGTVTLSHDAAGNLLTMTDPSGTTAFEYDLLDRMTGVQHPFASNGHVGYMYDDALHQTKIMSPLSIVTYGYNSMNQLETVTDSENTTTTYAYDSRGLLTSVITQSGPKVEYKYDDAGRLIQKDDWNGAGEKISSFAFTLDKLGNRTKVEADVPLPPTFAATTDTAVYDPENQLQTWNATTYTSDNSGRLIGSTDGSSTTSLSFRFDDRLSRITTAVGTWDYLYNGLGNRIAAVHGTDQKRYILDMNGDMDRILAETDASGNVTARYVYGAGLLYRINSDGSRHYFHFDPLGSTIALTSNNTITDAYAYDPYGRLLNHQGTDKNPFLYVGQHGVMQEENSLLFMRARFYDSKTNRFISRDPVKGQDLDTFGTNPFLYTGGNPIIAIDPKGQKGETTDYNYAEAFDNTMLAESIFEGNLQYMQTPIDPVTKAVTEKATSLGLVLALRELNMGFWDGILHKDYEQPGILSGGYYIGYRGGVNYRNHRNEIFYGDSFSYTPEQIKKRDNKGVYGLYEAIGLDNTKFLNALIDLSSFDLGVYDKIHKYARDPVVGGAKCAYYMGINRVYDNDSFKDICFE